MMRQETDTVSSMEHEQKVVVVLPAYNAEKTLRRTYEEIPRAFADNVILVDDKSADATIALAPQLGIKTFVHPENRGYGGNQKTCYKEALKLGADIVVMLHPDYQYDPKLIPELIRPIQEGKADLILGSRLKDGRALEGGMPIYKYYSNRFLTTMENMVLGLRASELHTGFRAYSRKFLETIPFEKNSEGFVFDTEIIVQAVAFGFRISEISVPCKYFPEASSISFLRSAIYGSATLLTLLKYIGFKLGIQARIFVPEPPRASSGWA